ncbi:MAG: hypothetical protein IPP74_12160 [Alphaproteobacteria bacterium]|nr:hypothetical protein [Alphaproteobacteria bacterium]
MKKLHLVLLSSLLLAACTHPAVSVVSPGQPESLLDVATQKVTLPLRTQEQVDQLVKHLEHEQPANASLQCNPAVNPLCQAAQETLQLYGISSQLEQGTQDTVTLVYNRIAAKPCDNRFVSNHYNLTNQNHKAFGCSVASNMVQMVTDRSQFTDPHILDLPDASNAVSVYDKSYLKDSK